MELSYTVNSEFFAKVYICETSRMRNQFRDNKTFAKWYNHFTGGVGTQLQFSGLVAYENSTFRNLALAVYVPFMA